MSLLDKFFAFSFISVFAVTLLATWLRYSPSLIALYRVFLSTQANGANYFKDNLNS